MYQFQFDGMGGSAPRRERESGMGGADLSWLPSLGGGNAGAAPAASTTYDQLSAGGGGMDVMGSLQKHSKSATQYVNNPGASAMSYGGG